MVDLECRQKSNLKRFMLVLDLINSVAAMNVYLFRFIGLLEIGRLGNLQVESARK